MQCRLCVSARRPTLQTVFTRSGDSSTALCGVLLASASLADIHPESSESESNSDSDEAEQEAPPTEQAATRHAAALPSRKLKCVLKLAGQESQALGPI
jgi:hypothetical protein